MTQSAPTADHGSQSMNGTTSNPSGLQNGNGCKLDLMGAWILAAFRQGKLDARDLHIIDGRAQGRTEREIGLELGITGVAVHKRIHRMVSSFRRESLPVVILS